MNSKSRIISSFVAGVVALSLMCVGLVLTASSASAGDEPTVGIEHSDRTYTKAEVDKITAKKQADAKAKGLSTQSVAAGCYDWWSLANAVISGGSIYENNIGLLRLYYNPCNGGQNKARTEHINGYVSWYTYTAVTICAVNGAGQCVNPIDSDDGQYRSYAGDVVITGMNGRCVKATGAMKANKSNGAIRTAQLGPGWCG